MTTGGSIRSIRLFCLALALLIAGAAGRAQAATFTVNSADDANDGTCDVTHCSLREAITAANAAPGADRIEFDIAPGGVTHTITVVGSELPALDDDLTIDGYTQPGASENNSPTGGLNTVLRIELTTPDPLIHPGLRIQGSHVTIRGLAINGFLGNVFLDFLPGRELADITVAGNFLGTTADGLAAAGSEYGVIVGGAASCIIGGLSPADRNLISGNMWYGIRLNRYPDSTPLQLFVLGNLIGTDVTGDAALANNQGIWLDTGLAAAGSASDIISIGGTGAGEANVIAGNASNGIFIGRSGASPPPGGTIAIAGNILGTNASQSIALPNAGTGIFIGGAIQATVTRNVVAHSGGPGVTVMGPLTGEGAGVTIRNNELYANAGGGIDLGGDGRTTNDAGDSDTGANALLNFPVLATAAFDASSGTTGVSGTIQAEPNTTYAIEVFNIGPSGGPPGYETRNLFLTFPVTTDATGAAQFFEVTGVPAVQVGDRLTATLTDLGGEYTSEISEPVVVSAAGPGIAGQVTVNGNPVENVAIALSGTVSRVVRTDSSGVYLFFDLPAGGNYTVTPEPTGYVYQPASREFPNLTVTAVGLFSAAAVPATYTVNVTHDGGDGWCTLDECTLFEAINEANNHPGPDAIHFNIPGPGPHTIALDGYLPGLDGDLIIDGYTQPGATPNTNVSGGLNGSLQIVLAPGAISGPNPTAFEVLESHVTIRGLVIAGFDLAALVWGLDGATDVVLEGNYFGTTPDGTAAVPGSMTGIATAGSAGLTIGGTTPASRNLISGHGTGIYTMQGIDDPASLRILGNLIGTDVTGLNALPNMQGIAHVSGFDPAEADVLRIGGDTEAERNVISGNDDGIFIARNFDSDLDDADQVIAGNYIGVAADGVTPLGNTFGGLSFCGELTFTVRRNVIAHNGGSGAQLCTTPTPSGRGIALSENVIHDNFGLAIDLDGDGRTPNDADDSDTGPNELQNFPVITSVLEGVHGATVSGELTSLPNRAYRVELFTTGGSNPFGRDARAFIGAVTVTTDGSGLASFTHALPSNLPPDEQVAGTATDEALRLTSELSDSLGITPLPRVGISGTITLNGTPMPNVRVDLTGDRTGSMLTGMGGSYAFANLPMGGSYIVTPDAAGHAFTPPNASLANLQADGVANFTAQQITFTRYLPEGATGGFWQTSIALLNGGSTATQADVAFLLPDGHRETITVPLTGPGHVVLDPETIPALENATFSTVVTSAVPLVASRTMRWGEQRELGMHAEQAVLEPRTSWYLAEGSTGCFDLFYLLVNPGATPAEVDVTYVRRAPDAPIVRHHTLGPFARMTIRVNDEEGLSAADVSGQIVVANHQPIVAERVMYSSCFGTTWRGGLGAAATAAPAKTWYFAEGATGSFFDFYLLLANFEPQAAALEIEYLLADGTRIIKPYALPASSRLTLDVAGQAPQLASATVSAIVRSTNDVPIVAERAQWWLRGGWYEGHVSAGVTESGVEWQLAGAQVGGADGLQGYLLIANTGGQAGLVQVRAVFADGTTTVAGPMALVAHSRTTISLAEAFPQAMDQSFGLVIESLGATPAPIVVELSTYGDTVSEEGRRFWGAGTNVVATRIR